MDVRYKILEDREKRINIIKNHFKYNNNYLIIIKCNICGNDKNISETNILLSYFKSEVINKFNVLNIKKINSFDGNYFLVEIENADYIKIKKNLVLLENEHIGRFIDLDLYINGEKSISRSDINIEKRKCFICKGDYTNCMYKKNHTAEEVIEFSTNKIKDFFVNDIVNLSVASLYDEVKAHPKFGLVTSRSNGKHKDMNYNTFVKSINTIAPYFIQYANCGFHINKNTFKKLRGIGIIAEQDMFNSTKNINTHKGIIFLYGFLIPSIVNCIYNCKPFSQISDAIKHLAKDLHKDFENIEEKETKTYGENAFIKYKIMGIRGEVINGLDIVFRLFDSNIFDKITNDNIINMLLIIMSKLDDTVVLHNNSIDMLNYVKNASKEMIKAGSMNTLKGKKLIEEYTDKFINLNISPGGSADMVSVLLTLIKVKNKYYG